MAKVTPISEQFQHFVSELKDSFWGDCRAKCSRVCADSSSCCRSGNATCTW